MLLAARANLGAATLALLKIAVYEEDGAIRVGAIEPATSESTTVRSRIACDSRGYS